MTIGDRIRYFRKKRGYSQLELSELAQMHHVTIRKYEANMRTPQADHLYKIADVLGVRQSSLIGIETKRLSLHTVGDLLAIIIVLCQSRVVVFFGDRDERGILKPETARLKLSPKISSIFSANMADKSSCDDIALNKLTVVLNDSDLHELLEWEREYELSRALRYEKLNLRSMEDLPSIQEMLEACLERKEILELELQSKEERLRGGGAFWDFA